MRLVMSNTFTSITCSILGGTLLPWVGPFSISPAFGRAGLGPVAGGSRVFVNFLLSGCHCFIGV